MKQSDIKIGETYVLAATSSPARKHLEGQPFTVVDARRVFRYKAGRRTRVLRFFNEDGMGVPAEELEDPAKSCHRCQTATTLTCGMCQKPVCEACTSRPETLNGRVCLTCDELPF